MDYLSLEQTTPLRRMRNPVRGFMDGGAALASLAGLITLGAVTIGDAGKFVAVGVFGLSLIALYTTSALYHTIPWSAAWRNRMQRLDHSMIYVLVAGSWTPLAAVVLDGRWRITVLTVVWGLAMFGIAQKVFIPRVPLWFSIAVQVTMGYFALVPLVELMGRLSPEAIVLMFASGALYTIGLVLFALRRPRLVPRIFSYHEVFHVFVIAASALHFVLVLRYVVPYPG